MPWVGSDFQRVHNFSADASASINMLASRFDAEFDGIAVGLEACLKTDGTNAPAADFAMAGFKHTNVAAATSTNQYLRLDQFQQLTPVFCELGGTVDAIAISTNPTYAALVSGHTVIVSAGANTTTSATLNVNGTGALPIRLADGSEIGHSYTRGVRQYVYRGSYWAMMNPPTGGAVSTSTNFQNVVVFSASVTFVSAAVFSGSASFTSATIYDGTTQTDIGYRDIPVVVADIGRELTIADRSKQLYHATTSVSSFVIPACVSVAFPVGTAIMVVAGPSSGVVSVSAAPTVTLYRAGTGSTGTRILSAACDGLFVKVAADLWKASGSGLT